MVSLKKKRIIAMVIDYYLIVYICYIPLFLFLGFDRIAYAIYFIMIEAIFLIMIKDLIFGNASVGKKMIGIQVLKEDGSKPRVLELLFRNIFIVIWPIEVILVLCNNKRIGDILFKTEVVFADKKLKRHNK